MSWKYRKHHNMPAYKSLHYLRSLILRQYLDVLKTVNILYPTLFTRDHVDAIFAHIKATITFTTLGDDRETRITRHVRKRMAKRIIRNHGIPVHFRTPADPKTRCHARIWAEGRIIRTSADTVIYGEQCYRKESAPDSHYCHQHIRKNSHGDFDKPISDIMRYNFIKHNRTRPMNIKK